MTANITTLEITLNPFSTFLSRDILREYLEIVFLTMRSMIAAITKRTIVVTTIVTLSVVKISFKKSMDVV